MIIRLFALLIGHAFADYAVQSGEMSRGKRRYWEGSYNPMWPYWLTSHALIHGGVVWLVTGSVCLGLLEFIGHWCIDFGKCEKWYGVHLDQTAHVACKVVWAALWSVI